MTWPAIAAWIGLGLLAAGMVLVGLWAVVALVAMLHRTTPGAPVGEAPDDTMAVADAVAERPPLRQVSREERIRWRASDAWMAYAEADTDWHALEYLATGKRTEVTRDGR